MATALPFVFKLLVAGPFGVGKTTLIEQISLDPVVGTEVATTGDEAAYKETTTVGIEYGVFRAQDGDLHIELLLFGSPGQDRFRAAREVAARGMDGLLLLVDGTRPDTWAAAAELYHGFGVSDRLPVVIGVNRIDQDAPTPDGLLATLAPLGQPTVCHGSVRNKEDARRFIVTLLADILAAESDLEAGQFA